MKVLLGLLAGIIVVAIGGFFAFQYIKTMPVANQPVIVQKITKEVIVRTGGKVNENKPPKKDPVVEMQKELDKLVNKYKSKSEALKTLQKKLAGSSPNRQGSLIVMYKCSGCGKPASARAGSSPKACFYCGSTSFRALPREKVMDSSQKQKLGIQVIKMQKKVKELRYKVIAKKRQLRRLKKKIEKAKIEAIAKAAAKAKMAEAEKETQPSSEK